MTWQTRGSLDDRETWHSLEKAARERLQSVKHLYETAPKHVEEVEKEEPKKQIPRGRSRANATVKPTYTYRVIPPELIKHKLGLIFSKMPLFQDLPVKLAMALSNVAEVRDPSKRPPAHRFPARAPQLPTMSTRCRCSWVAVRPPPVMRYRPPREMLSECGGAVLCDDSVSASACGAGEQVRKYEAGQLVVEQGDLGTEMYVTLDGKLQASLNNGTVVGDLGPFELFGEMSLLRNLPRMATVHTVTLSTVVVFHKHLFDAVTSHYPEITGKLEALVRQRELDLKMVEILGSPRDDSRRVPVDREAPSREKREGENVRARARAARPGASTAGPAASKAAAPAASAAGPTAPQPAAPAAAAAGPPASKPAGPGASSRQSGASEAMESTEGGDRTPQEQPKPDCAPQKPPSQETENQGQPLMKTAQKRDPLIQRLQGKVFSRSSKSPWADPNNPYMAEEGTADSETQRAPTSSPASAFTSTPYAFAPTGRMPATAARPPVGVPSGGTPVSIGAQLRDARDQDGRPTPASAKTPAVSIGGARAGAGGNSTPALDVPTRAAGAVEASPGLFSMPPPPPAAADAPPPAAADAPPPAAADAPQDDRAEKENRHDEGAEKENRHVQPSAAAPSGMPSVHEDLAHSEGLREKMMFVDEWASQQLQCHMEDADEEGKEEALPAPAPLQGLEGHPPDAAGGRFAEPEGVWSSVQQAGVARPTSGSLAVRPRGRTSAADIGTPPIGLRTAPTAARAAAASVVEGLQTPQEAAQGIGTPEASSTATFGTPETAPAPLSATSHKYQPTSPWMAAQVPGRQVPAMHSGTAGSGPQLAASGMPARGGAFPGTAGGAEITLKTSPTTATSTSSPTFGAGSPPVVEAGAGTAKQEEEEAELLRVLEQPADRFREPEGDGGAAAGPSGQASTSGNVNPGEVRRDLLLKLRAHKLPHRWERRLFVLRDDTDTMMYYRSTSGAADTFAKYYEADNKMYESRGQISLRTLTWHGESKLVLAFMAMQPQKGTRWHLFVLCFPTVQEKCAWKTAVDYQKSKVETYFTATPPLEPKGKWWSFLSLKQSLEKVTDPDARGPYVKSVEKALAALSCREHIFEAIKSGWLLKKQQNMQSFQRCLFVLRDTLDLQYYKIKGNHGDLRLCGTICVGSLEWNDGGSEKSSRYVDPLASPGAPPSPPTFSAPVPIYDTSTYLDFNALIKEKNVVRRFVVRAGGSADFLTPCESIADWRYAIDKLKRRRGPPENTTRAASW
ncbi:hypothetical protein CYMTET_47599 [Cymbomonas tetramitiformis]|uniref:Cyclic nucleotide-binding domain-containing protein n=1 Tax=Cymbomonas tetramitiformis TaxID=36881 RepID=A0AAE0EVU2_9CHLO|nr:hypothetical protein CYMTET_47599 [Cymbomonas tetramitiformis]